MQRGTTIVTDVKYLKWGLKYSDDLSAFIAVTSVAGPDNLSYTFYFTRGLSDLTCDSGCRRLGYNFQGHDQ